MKTTTAIDRLAAALIAFDEANTHPLETLELAQAGGRLRDAIGLTPTLPGATTSVRVWEDEDGQWHVGRSEYFQDRPTVELAAGAVAAYLWVADLWDAAEEMMAGTIRAFLDRFPAAHASDVTEYLEGSISRRQLDNRLAKCQHPDPREVAGGHHRCDLCGTFIVTPPRRIDEVDAKVLQ